MNRNISIDIIKAIAALFIINSHLVPMYQNVNPALATFGVHGDAMFFFCAGFVALFSLKKLKQGSLFSYLKKRYQRLYPTVFVFFLLNGIFNQEPIDWRNLLYAKDFWFISHIFISYAALYILYKYQHQYLMRWFFGLSLVVMLSVFFFPATGNSIYFDYIWHYCFFPCMLLGLILSEKESFSQAKGMDYLWLTISFASFFLLAMLGKLKTDITFYFQILTFIPLNIFLYFAYKCGLDISIHINKVLKFIILLFSSLTLELYMVHYSFISPSFNEYFPFNILGIYCISFFAAYALRILTNLYNFIMEDNETDIKSVLQLWKSPK